MCTGPHPPTPRPRAPRVPTVASTHFPVRDVSKLRWLKYRCIPIEKIDAFVKNIPVRMIVAKLKNGMPLMLTHHLGSGEDEESHVRFLVAPKSDEY